VLRVFLCLRSRKGLPKATKLTSEHQVDWAIGFQECNGGPGPRRPSTGGPPDGRLLALDTAATQHGADGQKRLRRRHFCVECLLASRA
jgi:hypothetical protein